MSDEGSRGPSEASDDDPLLRALARAPSQPIAAEGDADAAPTRVAHFAIDGRLGAGGMGVVYRAHDESLRREVAVKLLPAVNAGDPERRQRFLREARVAAALVHPNVAVVYQVGEADGRVYIAMELVEGETLRTRLGGRALPAATARDYALQIAQGLAAAHAKKIVHRDLKPENVMVTRDGVVKLLDFGLAKSGWAGDSDSALVNADTEAQLTREGHVLGSSGYMSPEQAVGMPVDARSDVFSFGILLYEMLCGRRPFVGRTAGDIRGAIAGEAPAPLDASVEPGLAQIVTKCLEKRAQDRYSDAGILVLELAAVASSAGASRPGATTAPLERGGGGARVSWLIAAAAVATAGAALVIARAHGVAAAPAPSSMTAVIGDASTAASGDDRMDDGANPSPVAEAERYYEQALLAEQSASCEASVMLLRKAVKVDPSFAAAHLRLGILNQNAALESFQHAVALEPTMSARDKVLLNVRETIVTGRDAAGAVAAAEDYLKQHPRDPWMWTLRVDLEVNPRKEIEILDRAVLANPSNTVLPSWKGRELLSRGDVEGARKVTDECLARAPRATDCLYSRTEIDAQTGACQDMETTARRWCLLEPESVRGHEALGEALASNGASSDVVRAALGPERAEMNGYDRDRPFLIPYYEGDFVEIERIGKKALQDVASNADPSAHFDPATYVMLAEMESGDLAAAGALARDLLAASSAWGSEGSKWYMKSGISNEAFFLNILEAAGLRSHAAAAARHRALLDQARTTGNGSWGPRETGEAFWMAYGDAKTPIEARESLRVADELGVDLNAGSYDWSELFARADAGERGRPALEAKTRHCEGLTSPRRMLLAHLALGRLDEAEGKKESACDHYARVIARWEHAKPRSVSVDEARTRAKALGCAR